jgi:small-conductance mechanosensitive channel
MASVALTDNARDCAVAGFVYRSGEGESGKVCVRMIEVILSTASRCGAAPRARPRNRDRHARAQWLASRCGLGFLALCILAAFAVAAPSAAEAPADPIEALVNQAREGGLRVIILDPAIGAGNAAAKPAEPPGPGARAAELTGRAVARLREVIGNARQHLAELPATLAALAPDRSPLWPLRVAGVALLGLILGHVAVRVLSRRPFPPFPPAGSTRSERLRASFWLGLVGLLGLVGEIAFALVLPVIVFGGSLQTRTVLAAVVDIVLLVRLAMVFFGAVLAADDPRVRPVTLGDAAARRLWSHLRLGLVAILVVAAPLHLFLAIDAPPDLEALVAIFGTGMTGLILIAVILSNRAALEDIAAPAAGAVLRKWWIVAAAYIVVAWLVSSVRWLLGLPHAFGLIGAPIVGAMIAITLYGLLLIAIDRLWGRAAALRAVDLPAEETLARGGGGHWSDRVALALALAVAAIYVLDVWGAELRRADGRVGPLGTAALTLVLGYAAWAVVRAWFDRKIAEEVGERGPMPSDDAAAAVLSRLGTLLPLFRNIVLAGIMLVAAMMLLLEAGVNIAPLFAGAGILGLAIGFGSQTLIRDIFSGLFFLVDDAFRVGEYIETGAAKGTVERISIRSMQLRHQNGPLHTIPFGEIQQLTNYSRDWVIMKLPLRVTLDTDPERVRKLIKRLGQELLDDPLVGPKFVEPLKSQGVLSIDNFGMVIRVKFMTRPGDQFVTRRVVYARIHELFEQEGIEFASRDVRVRVDPAAAGDPRIAQTAAAFEAAEGAGQGAGPESAGAGAGRGDDR